MPNTIDHQKKIKDLIKNNHVFIFMKGSPDSPMCGFTSQSIAILKRLKTEFGYFDVLQDEEMRQAIKDFTDWPTIPQIFINGEFIGGSDILLELFQNGELQKMLK